MTSIRQEIRRITQQGQGPFNCHVTVEDIRSVSPGFRRVTVQGDGLEAYRDIWPADAFKLLFPPEGATQADYPQRDESGMPYWPEGGIQPLLRAYTVRSYAEDAKRIEFDVVEHAGGPGVAWLNRAESGDVVGLAGMRHEFFAAPDVDRHLIVGDASALPAVAAILESLDDSVAATVCLATTDEADVQLLPDHPGAQVYWVFGEAPVGPDSALERLVRRVAAPSQRTQAWIAAEASVVRELRRFALSELGVDRPDLQARAYWKAGVDSTAVDAESFQRYQNAVAAGADITDPDVVDRMEFENAHN